MSIKKYREFINESASEEIAGGKSSGMSLIDIAKKHSYDDSSDSTSQEKIDDMYTILTKQLEIGISVELEHTGNEDVAMEIAMDHLEEDPRYYEKLGKAGLID
jgi:hypothetical protein